MNASRIDSRRSVAILAGLLLTVAGLAHASATGHLPAVTTLPFDLPIPSLEPEHLYAAPTRPDRIGRIVAPVMINGQGPFRLIVDTGANQSVVTTRLATRLGLVVDLSQPVKLSGVTGSVIVPTVPIERFETGDLLQENLRLPVVESVMGGADGILGMQGFEDKRITVDFINDEFRIADSRGQRLPRGFVRLPVTVRFNRLLLASGRVAGIRVKAVIDTGAQRTLGNPALLAALQERRRFNAPHIPAGVIGMSEVMQRGQVVHTRRIQLGDITLSDVDVIYGDIDVFRLWGLQEEPALLIGMDILGIMDTLIVDYRLEELQIRVRTGGFLQ